MDWLDPPTSYEELCLWKVFVSTCEAEVWQVVRRWLKKHGNPYVVPPLESEWGDPMRQFHQQALTFCYARHKR